MKILYYQLSVLFFLLFAFTPIGCEYAYTVAPEYITPTTYTPVRTIENVGAITATSWALALGFCILTIVFFVKGMNSEK